MNDRIRSVVKELLIELNKEGDLLGIIKEHIPASDKITNCYIFIKDYLLHNSDRDNKRDSQYKNDLLNRIYNGEFKDINIMEIIKLMLIPFIRDKNELPFELFIKRLINHLEND